MQQDPLVHRRNTERFANIIGAPLLDISQLHDLALGFRQLIDGMANKVEHLVILELFGGCITPLGWRHHPITGLEEPVAETLRLNRR